ncbi:nucleotidyltransferase family protein [Bdellovibrionota bacterium FG-2]
MAGKSKPLSVQDSREVIQRLRQNRDELKRLKIESLTLFGSFARDQANQKSDVDLIVEFSEPVGFFHFYDVKTSLEKILRRKVDLVMPDAVRPEFREQIEREKIRAA